MIVAAACSDLLIVGVDACANGSGLPKVEGCAGHVPHLTSHDQRTVHRGERVGIDHRDMVVDIALACQVEVAVIGQVDDRRRVAGRMVIKTHLVVIVQAEPHRRFQRARIMIFTVRAVV